MYRMFLRFFKIRILPEKSGDEEASEQEQDEEDEEDEDDADFLEIPGFDPEDLVTQTLTLTLSRT